MRFTGGAIVVGVALLLAAAPAQAAQRFAAPEAKGPEPCAQAAPCGLKEAVVGAKAEDEVILAAGNYTVTTGFGNSAKSLYIHGDFGGAMPRINASVPGSPFFFGENGRVAYLELFNTAGEGAQGFFCGQGMRIERTRIQVLAGNNATGLTLAEACQVRDSVIRARGNNAFGLVGIASGGAAIGRNLTVVASGTGSIGAVVTTTGVGAVDLRNTILSGETADIRVANKSKAFVGNSNFDSQKVEPEGVFIDLGGNQTAAPLFVDAAHDDFREAVGSPTIDAGVPDQLGVLDLAGSPRVIGAAVDIGAFEFVPPVAQIQSLAIKPGSFRAGNVAGAVASRRKKAAAPLGATVSYALSAAGSVELSVERKVTGRKVGKECVKQTAANKGHKKCSLFKPLKGSFSVSGAAGANSFRFSGRLGGKPLKPGSYRLTGAAGGAVQKAAFKIVK